MTLEFVDKSTVSLENFTGSDIAVARAAWVSNYGEDAREKDSNRVAGLINFLYTNRHMSPFEHGQFTFFIDTPIFVAREFMRHRTFSYNEWSGRYSDLQPRFYLPNKERPLIQAGKVGAYTFEPGSDEQYARLLVETRRAYAQAWYAYKEMIDQGIAREVARNVLPVGIMTKFYATVNPRNLMQFLDLRTDPTALAEIRYVAGEMEKIFAIHMPLTHNAWRKQHEGSSS